jgi:hypothetical protein
MFSYERDGEKSRHLLFIPDISHTTMELQTANGHLLPQKQA